MSTLNRKERRKQRHESNTAGIFLKALFLLSFIGIAVLVFTDMDIQYILGIFGIDILISALYLVLNKKYITTSVAVHTNFRVILSFLIMFITMFFYAFALWRADQFSEIMRITLFIGGAIVYISIYNATKTLLTK